MKLLLDTCTFLWIIWESPELSETAKRLYSDPGNDVYLSSVSSWEIALKYGLGKLPLPDDPDRLVPQHRDRHGIVGLPLDEQSALWIHRLPGLHRDPFDRMLVSQAITGGMTIVTPDQAISGYPVLTVW